jgi:SAC3 family protein LENG8/THP3
MIKGISREDMEVKLKSVITQAAESDNLHSVNWDTLPLPQQMLQEERNRSILGPSPPVSSWPPPPQSQTVPDPIPQPKSESLRKRKSSELTDKAGDQDGRPPWRQLGSKNGFEDRISFATPPPDKRRRVDNHGKNASKSHVSLEHRRKRFEDKRSGYQSPMNDDSSNANSPSVAEDSGPVIGRSQALEKNYFRLTAAPNPDTVRPLSVLRKTLELLKTKWKEDGNYAYICDQFKSLRQDLTVQHIKNEFTVNVYEIHARIALEKGDLGEYNQCQTQLRALYRQKLGGHPMEFKAYRILYFIHTCNRTDMNDVLSELTPADKKDPAVKHALDVRSAIALGNYHRFFQLYLDTPNMGAYLMDMFVARERLAALACICKA